MTRRSIPTLVPLALLALVGGGCGDSSSLEQAVLEASGEMSAIASAMPISEEREAAYSRDVIAPLRAALAEAGDDPAEPAANTLLAQATMGQGAVVEHRVREMCGELAFEALMTRSLIELASREQALVEGLRSFDPTVELDEYRAESQKQASAAADAQRRLADLEAEAAQLRSEMDSEGANSERAREMEADLRLQASEADPIRRAELIAEATERRREAERHERRAAEIAIAIGTYESAITSIRRESDAADERRSLADQAATRTRDVDSFMERQAGDVSRRAETRVGDLSARLDAALALANQDIKQTYDVAAGRYRSALGYARSADRDVSSALTSTINARLARLNVTVADSLERLAMLLERASSLPGSSGYADAARSIRGEVDELRRTAGDAFDSAASGFSRMGSGGAAREAEYVTRSFEASARQLRGEPDESEQPAGEGMDDDA